MAQNASRYSQPSGATAAAGWKLSQLTQPSALFGANGMRFGPDGRLYVAQAFGSQISALDIGDRRRHGDQPERRPDRRPRRPCLRLQRDALRHRSHERAGLCARAERRTPDHRG